MSAREELMNRVWDAYWEGEGQTKEALERVVDVVLEECATICDAPDRTGREWVAGSLWDAISKDLGRSIRSRKATTGANQEAA